MNAVDTLRTFSWPTVGARKPVLYEPRTKLGGLNEYGIAAYKTVDDFAAREVEYILSIGGIEHRDGRLGGDLKLDQLRQDFDAVFRRWSRGHRRAVKQAEREGVAVRLAIGEKDWQGFSETLAFLRAQTHDR